MLLKILTATALCFATSFMNAMELNSKDLAHQNVTLHQDTSNPHSQERIVMPKDCALSKRSTSDNVIPPKKNVLGTWSAKKPEHPIKNNNLSTDAVVVSHDDQDFSMLKFFPYLFSEKMTEEIFPHGATITEHLQVSIQRNDLEQVEECLKAIDLDKTFSKNVQQILQQAIEHAHNSINLYTKSQELHTNNNDNPQDIQEALDASYKVISHAFRQANQELPYLTGPIAPRCSFITLCASPAQIEQMPLVESVDNSDLVVGLCAVLWKAHHTKAKMIEDLETREKYLHDMSAINKAVLAAYKKQATLYEMVKKLYIDLKLLRKPMTTIQIIKESFPYIFAQEQAAYPPDANSQDLLQLALVRNDLATVQKNLTTENIRAYRRNLFTLCGTPHEIEKNLKATYLGALVIGLPSILVEAHALKAKLMETEEKSKKYLADLATINTLVWQAYETPPSKMKFFNIPKKKGKI